MKGFLKRILERPVTLLNKIIIGSYLFSVKRKAKSFKPIWQPGGKALILAPHQDDEILGCGCFILKMIKEGGKVKTVFFTDGSKSSDEIDPEELKKIRKIEAKEVARILGMEPPEFLNIEDGKLDHKDKDVAIKTAEIIKKFKPDLIMVPYFLDGHKDHSAVSGILINALELIEYKGRLFAYRINSPISVHGITHYIDCTDFMEYKANALKLYESQAMSFESILLMDRLNGIIADAKEGAELFRELNFQAYKKAYKKYNKDNTIWKSFKQMYSIYFMTVAYFKGIRLKKEIANFQNIKSKQAKEMEM